MAAVAAAPDDECPPAVSTGEGGNTAVACNSGDTVQNGGDVTVLPPAMGDPTTVISGERSPDGFGELDNDPTVIGILELPAGSYALSAVARVRVSSRIPTALGHVHARRRG